MKHNKILSYIQSVLENMPSDWLGLTTHRLDIYDEKLAKTEFLEQFEKLYDSSQITIGAATSALNELPTAYDYIRLGHPLSCILEWTIAHLNNIKPENVISFSSKTAPILAVLRKNSLDNINTKIIYNGEIPSYFDTEVLRNVYGYKFELQQIEEIAEIPNFSGSTVFVSEKAELDSLNLSPYIDFFISTNPHLGSILVVNGEANESYISEIQHVRRRETIAMTPDDCLIALQSLIGKSSVDTVKNNVDEDKKSVLDSIKSITDTKTKSLVGSSGLSIQYAIMIGLIHDAQQKHQGKAIKLIVPPNCYGGTNDQARRVAEALDIVDIVDLLVDGDNDMVQSIDIVLDQIAHEDAIPYIIAEIPTNPRVEVPDLMKLKAVLSKTRQAGNGEIAIAPVFILDQTFCPNFQFLSENGIFSTVKAISYASGSKFPSGGQCTAGYCVANTEAEDLMEKIELHLRLCDNEATALQIAILAKQLPSMNQRIQDAYANTREFVDFITKTLPSAKINFVSEELAKDGFTPSVFSLDLPTKGNTEVEKEANKRALNLKLINLMILEIPNESKFCVSYGQLKGCYWTIPATSTQGTTKEGDKDYIVRASLSPDMDLELHKKVFRKFVEGI
jgi:cystathionine beta-lyase/cystathionine gamma-synthase